MVLATSIISELKILLRSIQVLVELLSLDHKITELALSDNNFPNFEDGLQYYTAIENQVDVIALWAIDFAF